MSIRGAGAGRRSLRCSRFVCWLWHPACPWIGLARLAVQAVLPATHRVHASVPFPAFSARSVSRARCPRYSVAVHSMAGILPALGSVLRVWPSRRSCPPPSAQMHPFRFRRSQPVLCRGQDARDTLLPFIVWQASCLPSDRSCAFGRPGGLARHPARKCILSVSAVLSPFCVAGRMPAILCCRS